MQHKKHKVKVGVKPKHKCFDCYMAYLGTNPHRAMLANDFIEFVELLKLNNFLTNQKE